jgi:flagellar basal body rod protein FlgC
MSVTATIAISGMNAASLRLQVAAGNIANSDGIGASPNIDLNAQVMNLLEARVSFAANAAVGRADARMTASLLDILA